MTVVATAQMGPPAEHRHSPFHDVKSPRIVKAYLQPARTLNCMLLLWTVSVFPTEVVGRRSTSAEMSVLVPGSADCYWIRVE